MMQQLFFGNFSINDNFFQKISEIFYKKRLLDINNFDNLEDFFRYLYYKIGEKPGKNFLSTIYDIELLNIDKNQLYDKNFKIDNIDFYQKNLFLIYQENESTLKIFIDFLSEDIIEYIEQNFLKKYLKIEFVLCEKDFLIKKICNLFQTQLINNSINNLSYNETAKNLNFLRNKSLFKIFSIFFIFLLLSLSSQFFIFIFIIFANLCYLTSILYKIFLSFDIENNKIIDQNNLTKIKKYSIYTILLPIYKENIEIIKQLINSIKNIDYPQHKLDIKILVEENDKSINFSKLNLTYNFDIIYIPNFQPKTKAKACNFAINFSRGEFLVIYDSDDIPDSQQLKISISNFEKNTQTTCLQATLNSYNYNENFLTKFYSIEFDLWYKAFLPKMNSLCLPTTFGGTSNHFRIKILKQNLWDGWNVTEDADLGIRWWLKNLGNVKIINSQTLEEAPIFVKYFATLIYLF